ncbi:hypothetical protein BJV78DRAFT_1159260 [Lactifluus subvellereus]|nr:hypothetical protein BJV78DRAFT_1159260 [Lactifluus subvellereus]
MSGTPDAGFHRSIEHRTIITRFDCEGTFGLHVQQVLKITPSHYGLSSIPPALQPFREELGLAGADWDAFGHDWQALATLWLRAETSVSKSGRADLTIAEIRSLSIPDEWKEWMTAKLMKTDTNPPSDAFGQVLTEYLSRLPPSVFKAGGKSVMTQVWCRLGRTGIVGLLLCLHWQVEYSGTRPEWKTNLKRVECIFKAIIAHPDLQWAKRSCILSDRAPARKHSQT